MKRPLWDRLLFPQTLKRGWHLARIDLTSDFLEDLLAADAFACDLDRNLKEISNRLRTDTYRPHPLLTAEVPKGHLGFRPGSLPAMEDRTVLAAIVFLVAEQLDSHLPESVYSWRLKRPLPTRGPIFHESTLEDLPFLKKSTIRLKLDPFEPWYSSWPDFDQKSREAFGPDGYRYLAITDIAAYFENIQIPLLRDLLLELLPDEHRLVNLLVGFLESWATRTGSGRAYVRGIPQGNMVSSFLGNIFLLPLDREFDEFVKTCDARYYRYMDDVRVFTKSIDDARRAVFLMTRTLRRLHLNIQTAKTQILDEHHAEISSYLLDARVDELTVLIDRAQKGGHSLSETDRALYLRRLKRLAHSKPNSGQGILNARRPLEGLSLRAFSRWVTAHSLIGSAGYSKRLLKEITINPEYKLTRRVVTLLKQFPRLRSVETELLKFINSQRNIFQHQEAECLRALRYLDEVSRETIEHCHKSLRDTGRTPYLRAQAAYLLSRTSLSKRDLADALRLFEGEGDSLVLAALGILIAQRRERNSDIIRALALHSNDNVRRLGKLFMNLKVDEELATHTLDYILRRRSPWVRCDTMTLLHVISFSRSTTILTKLLDKLKTACRSEPRIGIRRQLTTMTRRVRAELKALQTRGGTAMPASRGVAAED